MNNDKVDTSQTTGPFGMPRTAWRVTVLLVFLLMAAVGSFLSLTKGSSVISLEQIVQILLAPGNDPQSQIIWNIRMPRTIVGALVGVNLALSGAILQAACCQTADHPHQRTMHPVAVKNHQAADACAQKCRHSHACKNNTHRLDAVLPRQNINADCCQHCANKGHRSNQIFHRREQNHNHHASQTCAGADADNMRVCQRITHNRLQNCTGKRQVDADQGTDNGARHTDVPNNLTARIITGIKQNIGNLLDADNAGAFC